MNTYSKSARINKTSDLKTLMTFNYYLMKCFSDKLKDHTNWEIKVEEDNDNHFLLTYTCQADEV